MISLALLKCFFSLLSSKNYAKLAPRQTRYLNIPNLTDNTVYLYMKSYMHE